MAKFYGVNPAATKDIDLKQFVGQKGKENENATNSDKGRPFTAVPVINQDLYRTNIQKPSTAIDNKSETQSQRNRNQAYNTVSGQEQPTNPTLH